MPGALGLRVAMLAAGLVAVAVIAAVADWSPVTIIVVMAAAFVAASAIEVLATSQQGAERAPDESAPKTHDDLTERVRRFELDANEEPSAEAETTAEEQEPTPAREPEPETEELQEAEEAVQEEPEAEAAPSLAATEPEPRREAERPPLVAVPAPPPPRPEPLPAPREAERVEPPVVVSLATRDTRVREWNLWELERLTREHAGEDRVRDEERNYLLMYMREFATPDGMLPVDFDALVRDSFGDLLATVPR